LSQGAILEDGQHLALELGRERIDVIQEQRPAITLAAVLGSGAPPARCA
jgi:hypothetical protein